jgi:urease accessory protein
LQLVSPALPVGAFAYSQGLEPAVAAGWITGEAEAARWITGLLESSLASLDLPVLARLHRAWRDGDAAAVARWSRFLGASRPSGELQAEERQLGGNLARLLAGLGVADAATWIDRDDVTWAAMFALAAHRWELPPAAAAHGYAFAWLEAQVSAAVRLVPLGQTAGQRILLGAGAAIPRAAARADTIADGDIGAAAPALAIASARHETQYSRLFRS